MNIGEWSEFYAFLKLLADGEIYGADGNLNKIDAWKYPVQSISRENISEEKLKFIVCKDLGLIKIEGKNKDIKQTDFSSAAINLLKEIRTKKTFEISDIQSFIEKILSPKIKAKTQSKKDISIVLHDIDVGRDIESGFSIKSMLGGKSTLFNAGSSNFIFEILGYNKISKSDLETLENLQIRDRITFLLDNGCRLKFCKTEDIRFQKNLQMIDSRMDDILSRLVLDYYSQDYSYQKKSKAPSSVPYLTSILEDEDPLKYDGKSQKIYTYKVKQFLTACALGMTAVKPWSGKYDANGGYLIVKKNGSLVCCHITHWNAFQDYLFNFTALDTPDPKRHKFGSIYSKDKAAYINLNFQIRFNLSESK